MPNVNYPQGIRKRLSLGYRSVVVTTLVNALRACYTSDYFDEEFQDLRVTAEYAFTRIDYPAIFVKYTSQSVNASGVGHSEMFIGDDGVLRMWDHRRFEGVVEFKVVTLSPLDLDILLDSLTEIISFARLDDQLIPFYYTIYGEPGTVQPFASQIALNSDTITDSGAPSVGPAPWQSEDVLIYQASLMCDVHGGFYNLTPGRALDLVWQVNQNVNLMGSVPISLVYQPELTWGPPFDYFESPSDGRVSGQGLPSATDATGRDQRGRTNIRNNTNHTQAGKARIV